MSLTGKAWSSAYKYITKRYVKECRNKLFSFIANLGYDMYLFNENLNYDICTNGESEVLKRLSKFQFKTFFDVGANRGEWSIEAANRFPEASIHAFEVIEETFNKLRKNTEYIKNIKLNNIGLSNKNTELTFKYYPDNDGKTSIYDFPNTYRKRLTTCKVTTGDDYLKNAQIESIDFLKIDVEGAEHFVLQGFSSALNNKKIKVIQFEYGMVNIISGFLLYNYFEYFRKQGYLIGKIFPKFVEFYDYNFKLENFIGPNFIAVEQSQKEIMHELCQKI